MVQRETSFSWGLNRELQDHKRSYLSTLQWLRKSQMRLQNQSHLLYDPLDIPAYLRFTRSPTAGANVLFLGTTRNNFDHRPVSRLSYSAYPSLALKSLHAIADDVQKKHGLEKVAIVHRLGEVKIEEESIAVAVSSGHRASAWKAAEEILERVKARAEIWKREWFADTGEVEEGVWRANKDRDGHGNVVQPN
ncbi:hypothetical protein PV04_01293 [Phialophora macrospora]|uniref:MOCS2B n=1 Tax=Phialophora macrospora TaxID=1851006 RepID=A0A0D2GLA3_9EURO|nr:hypothetical protein PV04_01293 [Phialophora macrospora]